MKARVQKIGITIGFSCEFLLKPGNTVNLHLRAAQTTVDQVRVSVSGDFLKYTIHKHRACKSYTLNVRKKNEEKTHFIAKINKENSPILNLELSSVTQCVQFLATPWTAAHQASLSITNSQSLPKLMSIESVMPSNLLILCHSLLLLPSIFPSIRVFSNESILHIRCPKYWSFSFSISPSNEY